jgi:hypothetical protein
LSSNLEFHLNKLYQIYFCLLLFSHAGDAQKRRVKAAGAGRGELSGKTKKADAVEGGRRCEQKYKKHQMCSHPHPKQYTEQQS